jgi:membrane protease YdiL (CAAX protease family)
MNNFANTEGAEIALGENASPEPGRRPANWRQSKWLMIGELVIGVLICIAHVRHFNVLGKTPWLVLLGSISLWVRKIGWHGVGLTRYRTWRITLLLGVAAGFALETFQLFVSQPLLVRFLGKQPDLEGFRALTGNLKLTLLFVALAWILAAFGEEMAYRGYLMNRVADLLNRRPRAWIICLVLVNVGFGLAHIHQGLTGVIDEGLMGLLLGLIYLRTGRNLSVPIVAHGVQDSIDFVLIFLGKYPGM